jgi:PPOX class probable F420-dependent enzyme
MNVPDTHRDLLDAPVGMLATIDDAGFPQVTATWFLYDEQDDTVKLSLNRARKKTQNMSKRPQASLFVLDAQNPGRYLEVRGRVELTPDDDYEFADRVGAKYGGADLRRMDQPGESRVVVSIDPVRVHAVKMG